jgi:hypothetical protein
LKTKKWIDLRIAEISAREAAAEALKKQYESQLELLRKKEVLEKERSLAIIQSIPESIDETENEDLQEMEAMTPVFKPDPSFERTASMEGLLLTTHEEENLFEIIEERITTINGQLNARNQKISDIEKQIQNDGEVPGSEKALEVLKRTAAGSLPASHELIRLLFDMLVHSNKLLSMKLKQIDELTEKEKNINLKNDDLQRQIISEKRNYDMELTTMNKEYEEKLQAVFEQISSFEKIQNSAHNYNNMKDSFAALDNHLATSPKKGGLSAQHPSNPNIPPPINVGSPENTSTKRLFRPHSVSSLLASPTAAAMNTILRTPSGEKGTGHPITPGGTGIGKAFDPLDIQLTIALEENKFLKSQNEKSGLKYSQLRNKCVELENIKIRLIRDIEEKNSQIKFLEEDRSLFKEMAEDLKNGLNKLGKDGKAVILSVQDQAKKQQPKKNIGLFSEYLRLADKESDERGGGDRAMESDDEDSASVIGQYQNLVIEINRHGGILTPASSSNTPLNSGGGATPSKNIYDRLTNPSYYTGHMKNVFENDLELKRKKIQQFKSSGVSRPVSVGLSTTAASAASLKGGVGLINKSFEAFPLGPPTGTSSSGIKFFPNDLMKSHSADEFDVATRRLIDLDTSQNYELMSSPTSHHSSNSGPNNNNNNNNHSRRKSIGGSKLPAFNIGNVNLPPHPPVQMKINLDHLSLEDDSLSHSSYETHSQHSNQDLPHPLLPANRDTSNLVQSPQPVTSASNVFTRLAKTSTASSHANTKETRAPTTTTKSSHGGRRSADENKDNSAQQAQTSSRTVSPAVNKSHHRENIHNNPQY